jgi:lysyl-tRNA synthetase class 2
MLKRARGFFEERHVLEVDTPVLARYAVTDPHIESIEVALQLEPERPWYLQTSPEYCMKRLLCAGYPDIYEICKVFRDCESGRYHQPEFTMVEWYRLNFGLNEIIQDTIDFIAHLVDEDRFEKPPRILSYRQAFEEFTDIDCATAAAEKLDLALMEIVLPRLETDRLTVLHHYPADQAALARICPDDRTVADRFEVFVGTYELANGYVELTDAEEQVVRFERDRAKREAADRPQRTMDPLLIAALRSGLPACAGVAVGFDRVQMLNEGAKEIQQVLSFPYDSRDQHG